MTSSSGPGDTLATLRDVLASASNLAATMFGDPLVQRLLGVFGRMPAEDRETILGVIEREVDLRVLTKDSGRRALSGVAAAGPNPRARLYLRVCDGEPPPYVAPEEIVRAVIRAARVMHGTLRGTDFDTQWAPAIAEALQQTSDAERESLRTFHRRMLDAVERFDRDPSAH